MRKIFYLDSCSTCKRIMKELKIDDSFEQQNIKGNNISEEELDFLKEKIGSYEAAFSRRAMKFRKQGLHEKNLTEADYRKLILEEYTFLKRPVIFYDDQVFVGNAKKAVAAANEAING